MRIRAGRLLMKLALALVLAVALSEVLTTGAFAQTNDYPFASSTPDTVDPYDFYTRECTSFVAWRMNRDAGTTDQAHPWFTDGMQGGTWGNAYHWNVNAATLGYAEIGRASCR